MTNEKDETSVAVTKLEGGKWELTTARLQLYKDSAVGEALGGGAFGAIGGLIGGVVKAASERKPTGDGIQLAVIRSVKAVPARGGIGTMVITFVNGKEVSIPGVHQVEQFAAKITEQVAKLRAAAPPGTAANAAATAVTPPATVAKPGAVLALDTRARALPGWQVLQQWSAASLDGDPADVRLKVDLPGTKESVFLRTKEEFGNCVVRLVYRFPVAPRFAYLALRVRSMADGKSYALVRLNNKGEFFATTSPLQEAAQWTTHPALNVDPTQWNEAHIELVGGTLRLFLNGTLAIAKDGLGGPTGRIVICGGGDPKPAEISLAALSIQAAPS